MTIKAKKQLIKQQNEKLDVILERLNQRVHTVSDEEFQTLYIEITKDRGFGNHISQKMIKKLRDIKSLMGHPETEIRIFKNKDTADYGCYICGTDMRSQGGCGGAHVCRIKLDNGGRRDYDDDDEVNDYFDHLEPICYLCAATQGTLELATVATREFSVRVPMDALQVPVQIKDNDTTNFIIAAGHDYC